MLQTLQLWRLPGSKIGLRLACVGHDTDSYDLRCVFRRFFSLLYSFVAALAAAQSAGISSRGCYILKQCLQLQLNTYLLEQRKHPWSKTSGMCCGYAQSRWIVGNRKECADFMLPQRSFRPPQMSARNHSQCTNNRGYSELKTLTIRILRKCIHYQSIITEAYLYMQTRSDWKLHYSRSKLFSTSSLSMVSIIISYFL